MEHDRRSDPMTFRGRELSVSLTVDDLKKSLAWYRDIVGFHVERENEHEGELRSASLLAGTIRIVLHQDDGAKGWDREKGEGLSLRITTAQDVDELAGRIKERGGVLDSEPADTHAGTRVFRITDPDGFTYRIAAAE
jgi:uncharacterized glyoxalase superfamily protein PhnB